MRLLLFNTRLIYPGIRLTMHLTIVRYRHKKPPMPSVNDPFFRLLCVEDNLPFQQILKLALASYGFEVITASHGYDALMQYKASKGHFGAILTDHDMPNVNGLEFVRSIRELGYKGRIILMSGRLTADELQEYAPYAINGFFHKPFDVGMLATMLLQAD